MATKKPRGLGRGLEALLGPRVEDVSPAAAASDGEPHTLALDQLQAGKYQPRTRMDEGALYELAESIKAQGVMQPVLVRPVAGLTETGAKRFEIIAGERRFRAARLAGLDAVPVLVRDVSDEAAAAMALIENIQREDLNPLEEARGLHRLTEEFGMTHEAAARSVGRSRSAASNLLRLLKLSEPVQQMLLAGDLEMGHARALLPLDGAAQILGAHEIVARKLSVRDAEKLVGRRLGSEGSGNGSAGTASSAASASATGSTPGAGTNAANGRPRELDRLERQLADLLAAPVRITSHAGRGKRKQASGAGEVVIGFATLDELNGLLAKLGHHEE